jgi:superfamily I DNA/RNA helicase/mRNA-degrading endonuclease RelE of RelBE toxin-antitoxin system
MASIAIALSFADSLGRLTGDAQKAVKTTAFDLQMNPEAPGLSFHKLDRARDKKFWSVRVSQDIRIIVHKDGDSLLLCYVDHHDKAYAWAERRKLEVHPTTGAVQLVEIRETVREVPVITYVPGEVPTGPEKALTIGERGLTPDDLLKYGVPEEWLDDVLAATDVSALDLVDHLPQEAAEAVLELAIGHRPTPPAAVAPSTDPFAHPDAQRRFRVMQNVEELERALDYPWDKWSVFLHPAQRDVVERRFGGPARVAGSAGTGKTVVALHRAVYLARQNPDARVLLTTFSVTLARMLRQKLLRLTAGEADLESRITVDPIDEVGFTLYQESFGTPQRATQGMIRSALAEISRKVGGHSFSDSFLLHEWTDVVDAWQLSTWEAYRDVARLGRKTRLGEKQRAVLWKIFSELHRRLEEGALFTPAMIFAAVTDELRKAGKAPFQHAVVDEAQDVNVPQLRFLAALAGDRPDGLFFAGDLGQRIFQTPFSWKSLGVDVRGRSSTLRINYRTSHQIRQQADRLLGPEMADVDGNVITRRGTISVLNGAEPEVRLFPDEAAEERGIDEWLKARLADGVQPEAMAVFVRSSAQVERARRAVANAGLAVTTPAPGVDPEPGKVVLMPMHQAKGLEFRAVVTACCDDGVLPLQPRIEAVVDESDLEDVYNTERQLLYVACTRARDWLLVTGVEPGSEFLGDLGSQIGSVSGS